MDGKSLKTTDSAIAALYASPNKHQEFAQSLGFQVSPTYICINMYKDILAERRAGLGFEL